MIKSVMRSADLVARFGGEEFVILLPNTGEEGAYSVAESVRKNIEEIKIPNIGSMISGFLTVSLGVITKHDDIETHESFVHGADMALYDAKKKGRNLICSFVKI